MFDGDNFLTAERVHHLSLRSKVSHHGKPELIEQLPPEKPEVVYN
jgi:hypothetical protein